MKQDSLLLKHLQGKFDSLATRLDNTFGKIESLDTDYLDASAKRIDLLETYVRNESNFNAVYNLEPFMWWYGVASLIFLFLTGRMVYLNYKIMRKLNK